MKPDTKLIHLNIDPIIYTKLVSDIPWQQQPIKIFGRLVKQPRLFHWEGDMGITYTYSHLTLKADGWSREIFKLKQLVEELTTHKFNSVLLNYYRNGFDYMGWHSDDEKELGTNPIIASLSLGVTRPFYFRHKKEHSLKIKFDLKHGDLLLMDGGTQSDWQHSLPKRTKINEARINLTFRLIKF